MTFEARLAPGTTKSGRPTEHEVTALLEATGAALLVVDQAGCIHKFTAAAGALLKLPRFAPGCPLADTTAAQDDATLLEDIQSVFARRCLVERHGRTSEGAGWLRQARPVPLGSSGEFGVAVVYTRTAGPAAPAPEPVGAPGGTGHFASVPFLDQLSHDLRSPLANIRLWGRVLERQTNGQPTWAEGLQAILRSAAELERLLPGLSPPSKRRLPQPEEIEVSALVRHLADEVRETTRPRRLVSCTIDDAVGVVRTDRLHLQQVVESLLRIGLEQAAPDHGVYLHVSRVGAEVLFHVSNGPRQSTTGWSVSRKTAAADAAQAEAPARPTSPRDPAAARLRGLVEARGGQLWALHDPNTLLTEHIVRLRLPVLGATAAGGGACPEDQALDGLQILVVEDSAPTRDVIALVLRLAGAEVIAVDSSSQALRVFQNEPPDVIVSDLGLPKLDGFDLIAQLRTWEHEAKTVATPALALTAFASDAIRQRALRRGFDRCLTKPVDPASLVAVVGELATQETGSE